MLQGVSKVDRNEQQISRGFIFAHLDGLLYIVSNGTCHKNSKVRYKFLRILAKIEVLRENARKFVRAKVS